MKNEEPLGNVRTGEACAATSGGERLVVSVWVPPVPASQGTDRAHTPWTATRLRDPLTDRKSVV